MQKYMCKKMHHFRFNIFFSPSLFSGNGWRQKKNNNSNRRSFEFHRSTAASSMEYREICRSPCPISSLFLTLLGRVFSHGVRARYREKRDRAGTNAQKLKRKKREKRRRRKEKRLSVVQQHVTLSLSLSLFL